MFQNYQSLPNHTQALPPLIHQQITLNSLKDTISSLTYRINEIESVMNRKIDRSECLSVCEKKVSYNHLKQYLDELQNKIAQENQEKYAQMQQISAQKILEMSKRIKNISFKKPIPKNQARKSNSREKDSNKLLSQQLYLESNETMFSLIIEQIGKLKEKDVQLEKYLQNRNKTMINLNNEVCKKLQKLQISIDHKINSNAEISEQKGFTTSWSILERNTKTTVPTHKTSQAINNEHQRSSISANIDNTRIQMLSKSLETLQKEMLQKMNIKDLLPIIKQQTAPFYQSMDEVKEYIDQNVENTRKILSSQTQINKQISLGIRLGWWHSFQQEHEIAIINKELINLLPEVFQFDSNNHSNHINIAQQGIYLIKIIPFHMELQHFGDQSSEDEEESLFQIMIGTKIYGIQRETVLRLQKNSQLRLILRRDKQVLISIQKC